MLDKVNTDKTSKKSLKNTDKEEVLLKEQGYTYDKKLINKYKKGLIHCKILWNQDFVASIKLDQDQSFLVRFTDENNEEIGFYIKDKNRIYCDFTDPCQKYISGFVRGPEGIPKPCRVHHLFGHQEDYTIFVFEPIDFKVEFNRSLICEFLYLIGYYDRDRIIFRAQNGKEIMSVAIIDGKIECTDLTNGEYSKDMQNELFAVFRDGDRVAKYRIYSVYTKHLAAHTSYKTMLPVDINLPFDAISEAILLHKLRDAQKITFKNSNQQEVLEVELVDGKAKSTDLTNGEYSKDMQNELFATVDLQNKEELRLYNLDDSLTIEQAFTKKP